LIAAGMSIAFVALASVKRHIPRASAAYSTRSMAAQPASR
jgi:hypothetical protein